MAQKKNTKKEAKMSRGTVGLLIAGVAIIAASAGLIVGSDNADNNGTVVQAQSEVASSDTIVELAAGTDQLSTLVAAVQAADLVDTLNGDGPFTVFAPTNAAFNALPEGVVDSLLQPENIDQLTDILTYHVVPTEALAGDLTDGQELTTVQGDTLTVSIVDGDVFINGAQVVTPDVDAANGVVHIIDGVLIPTNTVVDIAVDNGFNTLVAAVEAAGLVETLNGEGPFTVFAPTDEAFAALPAGTLDSLLLPENVDQLTSILTYHVVAGDVRAADVVALDGQNVDTVSGEEWHVLIEGDRVFIANPLTAEKIAEVVQTDVIGDNGVVHIIDSVLLPPQ